MTCDASLKLSLCPYLALNLSPCTALWISITIGLLGVQTYSGAACAQTKTTTQATSVTLRGTKTQRLAVIRSAHRPLKRAPRSESMLNEAALKLRRLTPQLRQSLEVLSQLGSSERLGFALDAHEATYPKPLPSYRASSESIKSVLSLRVKRSKHKLITTLSQLEALIRDIHIHVTLYYQAPRSLNTKTSPATLRLRREVWSLLHRTRGFFQRSNERFCLRAMWRDLIANAYITLGEPAKSSLHRRHARACPPLLPITREVDRDE